MCIADFGFVSLQRCDFQALKELEMLLDRVKLPSHANIYAESIHFMKSCSSCIPKALLCITLQIYVVGYFVCYNQSLGILLDIGRL